MRRPSPARLLESWRDDIRKARPAANIDAALTQPAALVRGARGDFAAAATAAKLVDKVGDKRAFETRLAELGGADEDAPAASTGSVSTATSPRRLRPTGATGPIGVVTVAGNIVDGRAPLGTAGGDSIAASIEKGMRTGKLKAIVVRIDSPGGSALASERIRQALLAAREKNIPVVASMGNVAASGGYWVATAASHIVAEPSTITGSIGVFGILPSFQGSLEKLGIGADGVKTTRSRASPTSSRVRARRPASWSSSGSRASTASSSASWQRPAARPRSRSTRSRKGRVWSGGQARQLGLSRPVRRVGRGGRQGGRARQASEGERGITWLDRKKSWRGDLPALLRDDDSAQEEDPFASLRARPDLLARAALGEVQFLLSGPTIQARCLTCGPTDTVPVVRAEQASWFGRLLAAF
jgi:protease-4